MGGSAHADQIARDQDAPPQAGPLEAATVLDEAATREDRLRYAPRVRVSIVRAGGLAGLVATTVVDSASLPPEAARALRAKVEQTGLFALPTRIGSGTDQPDHFTYKVTVEDQGHSHAVSLSEEDLPGPLGALISWIDSLPDREERIAPPGRDGSSSWLEGRD